MSRPDALTAFPHPLPGGVPSAVEPPVLSPLERVHAPQELQRVEVSDELRGQPREQVLARLCAGRHVLHVGCSDWPRTDARRSLHLKLQPHCAQLDGLDFQDFGFDVLRPHVRGRLFSSFEQATAVYDLVLLPELLDRTPDPGALLRQVKELKAPHFALTVPDAYSSMQGHFDYAAEAGIFFEATRADRLWWFTPFTFMQIVRKFTGWRVEGLWFLDGGSLLMVASRTG